LVVNHDEFGIALHEGNQGVRKILGRFYFAMVNTVHDVVGITVFNVFLDEALEAQGVILQE